MMNFRGQLTRYSEGSVRELWAISYPLILSILSVNIMVFFDRLILARYNTGAMNAAVLAWLIFSIFQLGAIGIASIAEVFVGQYNGAKKLNKIGEPVWQMIWFSLMTGFIFIPLGLFAGPLFISNPDYIADGIPFFKVLMLFGPTFPITAALSAFFIGRGRVKLVMFTTVISNILNILLDFVLIFGVEGLVSALGAKGAAIATGIAQTVQTVVLLGVFLRCRHRKTHGTNQWKFKPKLFLSVLGVGIPNALSNIMDAIAWSVLVQILAFVSVSHVTVFTIGDSFFILFVVGFLGLQKGITTVAANYIGANREEILSRTLRSSIKMILIIMLFLIVPFFFFSEKLADLFFSQDPSLMLNEGLKTQVAIALRWLWVYFMFDAVSWMIGGILIAAGDTRFVMLMNSVSAWIFSVIPTAICVIYFGASPIITWVLWALYGFLNALCFFVRYKNKRWNAVQSLHAAS
jgi:MATE family multidrug resistance protein